MRVTVRFTGAAMAALLASAGMAQADVVADSVADFSGVQGFNGWHYGMYNVTADLDHSYVQTDFVPLVSAAWTGVVWEGPGTMPPWISFNAWAAHPDGTNRPEEHEAIRRWVSTVAGDVVITGKLAKWDTRYGEGSSNGTRGKLIFDGSTLIDHTLAWDDNVGISYEIPLHVSIGSVIDLVVGANGVDYFDGTEFTMTVTQVPGPATLAIAAAAVALPARRRRR